MNKRTRVQLYFEYIVDLIMLLIANVVSFYVCKYIKKIPIITNEEILQYGVILLISFTLIFFGFTSSINLSQQNRSMELISVLRNCLLTYMTLAVLLILTKNMIIQSRYLYISSLILFIVLSSIGRYILKCVLIRKFSDSKMASLVGLVTVSERVDDCINKLNKDWSKNVKGIVLLDATYEDGKYKCCRPAKETDADGNVTTKLNEELETVTEISGIPVVANYDNFLDWARSESLDEVFVNLPFSCDKKANEFVKELESMGIIVNINLPNLENIIEESKFNNFKCSVFEGYPTATFAATSHSLTLLLFKRIADIIGAIVGIIISTPIILVTAIPLLIESPGPLIFKQKRVGKNGRIFNIYKLRSMYVDAEERKKELMDKNKMDGLMFKMDDDPRITKVGKFIRKTSIDELPQFWNVLKGDMSLIGTRPPTIDEFEQYENHHKRRLSMRPGITGMWQVSGRSDITDFEEVVKLDCKYIDNWSLSLDAKILFKTFAVVLNRNGAE